MRQPTPLESALLALGFSGIWGKMSLHPVYPDSAFQILCSDCSYIFLETPEKLLYVGVIAKPTVNGEEIINLFAEYDDDECLEVFDIRDFIYSLDLPFKVMGLAVSDSKFRFSIN